MRTPDDLSPRLRELAEDQDQVVSRDQFTVLGVNRHRIRDQVRARRWRLVGRAVVLHRGPVTRQQRWWIAVLHMGQGTALASLTAAEAHGLSGWETDTVHVVVRNGARVHPLPWMRVHVSRRLLPGDVHPARRPPQVRASRAVLDSATWQPARRSACALFAAAVQQRVVTVDQLAAELAAAGQIRHRRILARTVDDIAGGSQALSEIDFVRICRKAGLPRPEQQVVRRDSQGRRRYLDARIRRPDGRVILVEVDGALHLAVARWWDDQSRSNDAVIDDDAIMLRFPVVALRTDQARVIAQLQRAYTDKSRPARRTGRQGARSA